MTDSEVLEICLLSNGNINNNVVSEKYLNRHIELRDYLAHRYCDIPQDKFTFREVIWRIKNKIEKRPKCYACGGDVKFVGKQSWEKSGKTVNGYLVFCSTKCSNSCEEVKNKVHSTNIERYGVPIPSQNEIFKEKFRNTMVSRYGVEHALQNKVILNRAKETSEKNYGVFPTMKNDDVKKLVKVTNIEKYGGPAPSCNSLVSEKIKKTNLERYGVESFLGSSEFKKLRDEHKTEWVEKSRNALLASGNINKSMPEKVMGELLKEIFGNENVLSQFRSEDYPFFCDFYLKNENLYIEYQGTYFHNYCLYDKERDRDKVEKLKEMANENHPSYKRIIDAWTIVDVKKFEKAKENSLNMLFIYPNWSNEWKRVLQKKVYSKELIKEELKKIIFDHLKHGGQQVIGETIW